MFEMLRYFAGLLHDDTASTTATAVCVLCLSVLVALALFLNGSCRSNALACSHCTHEVYVPGASASIGRTYKCITTVVAPSTRHAMCELV